MQTSIVHSFARSRSSLLGLLAALLLGLGSSSLAQAQGSASSDEAESSTPSASSAAAGVVNINSASEEELTRLPGIGPAKARAILELRAKIGRFGRLEDVLRVKGIGRKTFRDLMPMLRLDGQTTLTSTKSARARSTQTGAQPK